ncbi:MAG: hypothetical protein AAGG44_09725, partial [Planctomycetota bacterium]
MSRGPTVSVDLIEWLNRCESFPKNTVVQFSLVDYRAEDGIVLEQLQHRLMLTLQHCEQLPDLSNLNGAELLYLSGERLLPQRARQLQHVDGLRFLRLEVPELEPETVRALSGLAEECFLTIEKAGLTNESLVELAKLEVFAIELDDCSIESAVTFASGANGSDADLLELPRRRYLRLSGSL